MFEESLESNDWYDTEEIQLTRVTFHVAFESFLAPSPVR